MRPINHITEAALKNPIINAAYVEKARRDAWNEVIQLLQCLEHLEKDDPHHSAIRDDIMWIINLPGMR